MQRKMHKREQQEKFIWWWCHRLAYVQRLRNSRPSRTQLIEIELGDEYEATNS